MSYFTFLVSLRILKLPDSKWSKNNENHYGNYRSVIIFEQANSQFVNPRYQNISAACRSNGAVCYSWLTSGKEVDDAEVVDIMREAHNDERHGLVQHERQRNVMKHLPTVSAVNARCLEQILRDSGHSAHRKHHEVAEARPQVDDNTHNLSKCRVAKPRDGLCSKAECLQRFVHRTKCSVEQVFPNKH